VILKLRNLNRKLWNSCSISFVERDRASRSRSSSLQ
jgi:hypothetical protein